MTLESTSIRIRDKEVAAILGICKASVWNWVKTRPDFPKPYRDGGRYTYWLRHEVEAYALHGENWREATANAK